LGIGHLPASRRRFDLINAAEHILASFPRAYSYTDCPNLSNGRTAKTVACKMMGCCEAGVSFMDKKNRDILLAEQRDV
jgi:hypothetical protein